MMTDKLCNKETHNIGFPVNKESGPLLFVLDEAPLQHKIVNLGLFKAKTYANGL